MCRPAFSPASPLEELDSELQFPLVHPAVAAIIPGPRNAAEFNANLELLRHPPPALWADLRQAGLLHPEAPVPRPA